MTLLSITVIIIIIAVVMHMLTVILLTAYCYVITAVFRLLVLYSTTLVATITIS